MRNTAHRILLMLILLFSLSAVQAEGIWYQVEVIVFENLRPDTDGEVWPATPGYPETDQSFDLFVGDRLIPNAESAETNTTSGDNRPAVPREMAHSPYHQVAAGKRELAAVFSRMKRSAGYRPLLHLAWRQSGNAISQPVRVRLDSSDDPTSITNQPILDGTVRMKKSRFFHLDADLAYFLPASPGNTEGLNFASLVRLQESRKMRLNELHYLDHPLFGIVAYVSPVQMIAE